MKTIASLKQTRSPLMEARKLRTSPSKKMGVRELAQALPLTSLVDAFSIIVIYLLIGTQSGAIETYTHGLELPLAENGHVIEKEMAVLRIQDQKLYLNDQPVHPRNLQNELANLKKTSSDKSLELMVQADQELAYSALDPLIKASSSAGIEKLRFAVLPQK